MDNRNFFLMGCHLKVTIKKNVWQDGESRIEYLQMEEMKNKEIENW